MGSPGMQSVLKGDEHLLLSLNYFFIYNFNFLERKMKTLPDALDNAARGGHVAVGRRVVEHTRLVQDHGHEEADADANDDDVREPRDDGEHEDVLKSGSCGDGRKTPIKIKRGERRKGERSGEG